MKKTALALVLTLLFVSAGDAQTRYVLGVLKITLRTGPGTDHRVLGMIKTGQPVEVINADNPDWTRVRMPDGKEGWVLSRFLTEDPPKTVVDEQAHRRNASLAGQVDELMRENKQLKNDFARVNAELANTNKNLVEIGRSYETLKKESSQGLRLKAQYEKSLSDLSEQSRQVEILSKELSRIRFHQKIKWFLSGAGVLLLGFLIGLSVRSKRHRSSLR